MSENVRQEAQKTLTMVDEVNATILPEPADACLLWLICGASSAIKFGKASGRAPDAGGPALPPALREGGGVRVSRYPVSWGSAAWDIACGASLRRASTSKVTQPSR